MEQFFKKYKGELIALALTGAIIGYILYSQKQFKKSNNPNIIIGDKFATKIYENGNTLFNYDNTYVKDDMTIKKLMAIILKNPIPNKFVNRIFISIGFFDLYIINNDVDKLFKLLKYKFPRAKFYIVKTIPPDAVVDINAYYEKFKPYVSFINNIITDTSINDSDDIQYSNISKEITKIVPENERTRFT